MEKQENNKLIDYTDFAYLELTEDAIGNKLKDFSFNNLGDHQKSLFNSISDEYYNQNKNYWNKNKKNKIEEKMKYIDTNFKKYYEYEIVDIERDDNTGFYAMALKDENGNIIISYKGSDFDNNGNDWIHNIFKLPQDYLTDQGQQASNFFRKVADNNPDSKLTIAGHSLGGFLAFEAGVTNVGYINRIEKIYAFDAPGFIEEFVENNEDITNIFIEQNKIFETEMTFISRLMHRLQDENLNHLVRRDIFGNVFEAIFVHPISSFRKLYPTEKTYHLFYLFKRDERKLKNGELEKNSSKEFGNNLTILAEAMQIKPISYKDVNTGFTMHVTLNIENLTIKEFLRKSNKNLYWEDEERIIKKVNGNIKNLKKEPKYLVRGAILKCDKGSHMRRADLRLCHGVYLKKGPALHIEDCKVGEERNIKSFGTCSTLRGLCVPVLLENWLMGYEYTYIVRNGENEKNFLGKYIKKNLLRALTENSFLVCANGGLIEPISSGQEYYEENEKDKQVNSIMLNENLSIEIK